MPRQPAHPIKLDPANHTHHPRSCHHCACSLQLRADHLQHDRHRQTELQVFAVSGGVLSRTAAAGAPPLQVAPDVAHAAVAVGAPHSLVLLEQVHAVPPAVLGQHAPPAALQHRAPTSRQPQLHRQHLHQKIRQLKVLRETEHSVVYMSLEFPEQGYACNWTRLDTLGHACN